MICPQYSPIIGGYEKAAEALSANLADAGWSVAVVTERRSRLLPFVASQGTVTIYRLPCIYAEGLHVVSSQVALALFLLLFGGRWQIWHVHQYGWPCAIAIVVSRMRRRKVVLKLTSVGEMGISQFLLGNRVSRALAWIMSKVDACIALSISGREEALSIGIGPEKIHIIPNGVDERIFSPATGGERIFFRRKYEIEGDRVILYVGRLAPEKNVDVLIEGWKKAMQEGDAPLTLVIVGAGEQREHLESLSVNQGRVMFLGENRSVDEIYKTADRFALISKVEGLSNALLEAKFSGLPVIVSRAAVEAVPGLIGPADVVLETVSVESVAESLSSITADRGDAVARESLGVELLRYSVRSTCERVGSLYVGLLSNCD